MVRCLLRNNNPTASEANLHGYFLHVLHALPTLRDGQSQGIFEPTDPMQLMHMIGGGIIYYAVAASLLGQKRDYDPADPIELESFRSMLHQSLQFLISPNE